MNCVSLRHVLFACSHINQKTQFENPVMETRTRHNQEAPMASQPGLASSGKKARPTPHWWSYFFYQQHLFICLIASAHCLSVHLIFSSARAVYAHTSITKPSTPACGELCMLRPQLPNPLQQHSCSEEIELRNAVNYGSAKSTSVSQAPNYFSSVYKWSTWMASRVLSSLGAFS